MAISRARHEARIYTDNVQALPAAIARENVKLAALDIEKGVPQRRDRPEVGKGDHHDIGLHSKLVAARARGSRA